jgi:hypothetical protein
LTCWKSLRSRFKFSSPLFWRTNSAMHAPFFTRAMRWRRSSTWVQRSWRNGPSLQDVDGWSQVQTLGVMWVPKNETRQQKCWSCICGVRCAKSSFYPTVSNDKLSRDIILMPHLKTAICLGGKVRYGWTAHILIANGRCHFVAYIMNHMSIFIHFRWLCRTKLG